MALTNEEMKMNIVNEPIYPCNVGGFYTDQDGYTNPKESYLGLTKHEYFTSLFLNGLLQSQPMSMSERDIEYLVKLSVKISREFCGEIMK